MLPHLVIEDSDGIKYADYNSLIPLLVLAVNELNVKVTQLTARLDALEEHAGDGEEVPSEEGLRSDSGDVDPDGIDSLFNPALYQNIPNPFSADTHIRYCLPESVVQADLYIYDMQGHQIKRIRVEGRGESTVTIHGSELQAGMYIYALIADGQEIDSKRMILTK